MADNFQAKKKRRKERKTAAKEYGGRLGHQEEERLPPLTQEQTRKIEDHRRKFGSKLLRSFQVVCRDRSLALELFQSRYKRWVEQICEGRDPIEVLPENGLYKVALNQFRSYHSKQERRRNLMSGKREIKATEELAFDPSNDQGPRDVLAGRLLREALSKLPDDLRRMFVLKHVGEYSHAEIAQMLDIPLGTVKSRLARAAARLSRALDGVLKDA